VILVAGARGNNGIELNQAALRDRCSSSWNGAATTDSGGRPIPGVEYLVAISTILGGIVNSGSELKHWSPEELPVSLLRSSFPFRNHQLCRLGLPSFLPELPRCRGSSRQTGNHRLL